MHDILLIRHGQTDWNVQKRIMGALPIELNSKGVDQARQLADYLRLHPIARLYSSPHKRALQTSELIVEGRSLEIIPEASLREIEHGEWVGKTFSEIRSLPNYLPYYQHPEHIMGTTGESLKQVQERAIQFVESVRRQEGGCYVMVSHADLIKCVLLHYLRMPLTDLTKFRIDNASISYLHFDKRYERVICINQGVDAERLLGPKEFL